MIKLVALFKRPEDVEAFDAHYDDIHAPLMSRVPGLERLEVTRNLKAFRGEPEYYLIAEMYFRDQESFDMAMASDENRAGHWIRQVDMHANRPATMTVWLAPLALAAAVTLAGCDDPGARSEPASHQPAPAAEMLPAGVLAAPR